jgi:hypothetical protein
LKFNDRIQPLTMVRDYWWSGELPRGPNPKDDGMITSAEIQLVRNANPGAVLPGIDTHTGNPLPASSGVGPLGRTSIRPLI